MVRHDGLDRNLRAKGETTQNNTAVVFIFLKADLLFGGLIGGKCTFLQSYILF